MISEIQQDAESRMKKSLSKLGEAFTRIRTARAHPSLLDHVKVESYGSEVPIAQAATVNNEDARTLTITPWDKGMVGPIEKALLKSDLGLTPNTAGTVIRIILPPLTEERRRDLVKIVKSEAEGARVAVRNIRRDANQDVKDLVKEKMCSEDEARRAEQDIQKVTDQYVAEIEKMVEAKEEEVMTI